MTIIDLSEKPARFFDMEGGGRVQLATVTAEAMKEIRKRTVTKKVDFKKVDGTVARLEYEEVNEELQNALFWDAVIVGWENLFDGQKKPIPCTKENKVLLMSKSAAFAKFITESLKTLADDDKAQAEQAEKNS